MCLEEKSAIRVFTIGTGEDTTDESADAVSYAREFGVDHTVERVNPDQVLDLMDDVIGACGEPFGDYSMFLKLMVSRFASRDYKVILSGNGGDELFGGYPGRFRPIVKRAGDPVRPFWRRYIRGKIEKVLGIEKSYRYYHKRSLGDVHRSMLTHLPELLLSKVFPLLPVWPSDFGAFEYTSCEPDSAAQWFRWNEFVYHLPWVLMKVDRASMFHSLEARVPLLDREVINVVAQIAGVSV